jgi:hypothetical protein
MLEEKITRTRSDENQIQITILLTLEVPEMKILRLVGAQILKAEAVQHNHHLQIHHQEAILEEINKNILV